MILLLVLGAVERGYRDPRHLADLLRLSLRAVQCTLQACQSLRLLDSAGRLTNEGRSELRHARRRTFLTQANIQRASQDHPYYPVALRGAR
ncbi:hypothetical protein [Nocardia niigatensis]